MCERPLLRQALTTSRLFSRRNDRASTTALANGRLLASLGRLDRRRDARATRENARFVVVDALGALEVVRTTVAAVVLGRKCASVAVGLLRSDV